MDGRAARAAFPATTDLLAVELRDHLRAILAKMADVMASPKRHDVDELIKRAKVQGLARLQQRYDVRELMMEDRLLRRVIIEQVEVVLERRMIQAEQVALDMGIDIMLQEAVVAFVAEQDDELAAIAKAEAECLSFLPDDLNNGFGRVTQMLRAIRQRLASSTDNVST